MFKWTTKEADRQTIYKKANADTSNFATITGWTTIQSILMLSFLGGSEMNEIKESNNYQMQQNCCT